MVTMPDGSPQKQPPLVLQKTIESTKVAASSSSRRHLRLMMLGCEDHPPYGPTQHTASLFLDLFALTLQDKCFTATCTWAVSITIYRVKQGEYPQSDEEWDSYDGILLPGSFSSAYDNEPWITKLRHMLQNQVVAHHRPTLGICFGHQILAHSFATGRATKYPDGSRAGRRAMSTTVEGSRFFEGSDSVELYYTHGDMVLDLPECAVALAQEDCLPAQSAAYFRDAQEAIQFRQSHHVTSSVKPFAVTFQAHPEYVVDLETLERIVEIMVEKRHITTEEGGIAGKDAVEQLDRVRQHSIDALNAAATALGWFS